MKILVTGSSGTIGTRLCERLLADNHEVIGVDWVENKWQPDIEKITLHHDLRDDSVVDQLPEADLIIHLAANARVYDLVGDPGRARDNILTTFTVLEYARKKNVQRFIFASSREGYGNTDNEILTEDMVRIENCESPYTASKVGGEAFVQAYGRCYDVGVVILRFSNVFGMYDDSDRVVPLFIRQAKKNETLTVFGKEKCLDFTYIDDNVDGITKTAEKFDTIVGETINIATGESTTLIKCGEDIIKLTGSESDMKVTESRTGEVMRYTADITKAKKLLGYEPKVSFDEGIKKAVEWYGNH